MHPDSCLAKGSDHINMDLQEESSRLGALPHVTSRTLSSTSSAFYSAIQSPFFSPRTSMSQPPSTRFDGLCDTTVFGADLLNTESITNVNSTSFDVTRVSSDRKKSDHVTNDHETDYYRTREKERLHRSYGTLFPPVSSSLSSSRLRSCDVYIGFHGRKTLLLRFINWLHAELEAQGMSCFMTDRARCRNSRRHRIVERAMDGSIFGIVILTRKSFKNPYTIEELQFFSNKKNLVPLYFDLGPEECLVRDIVERRGELWEKHGGELWHSYGGLEKEWKDAVGALSRVDEWKLEARDGNWRDCILRAVTQLAARLGRRSVVDKLNKWREKVEKDEFPFPRNENFVGRKKEISELEFMLFGDVSGDAEREYFELKARPRRKNLMIGWGRSNSTEERRKGKDPVLWKESEKEIEMQSAEFSQLQPQMVKQKSGRRGKRRRSVKVVYGKGIACVSGESGIGKTELLLEFAYRFHQRFKMVLWVGGNSRYLRHNYLNLWSFLEVDVGVESSMEKRRIKTFEEQEEAAIARVRKELMRNVPFLVVIDNLESEKDWWDHKLLMDFLPRFGGETHVVISTCLPRVMNLEPLKLSYLSGVEAMSLMQQGGVKDQTITEIDALRMIEEKLGRLTLGLAIVGAILSELPINPSRLLDTINKMPLRDVTWNGRETRLLRKNHFLLQLFEVCFSIFDHADGPWSLATRMVLASGWFAPASIPTFLLALAAHKIPEKHKPTQFWKRFLRSLTSCGFTSSYMRKSEVEASLMLIRFNVAKCCTKDGNIQFNELIRLYARTRGVNAVAQAVVHTVTTRGSPLNHTEHIWAACFLLFGFGNDSATVEIKVSELLFLVKEVILPLSIRTFITFSRCNAALELLRLCTDALEAADQAFVAPVEKWLDKSFCWRRRVKTNAQLNPSLWQELALARATVLETRAKLMVRGGMFDLGDDLIRKAIFIRTSICGEDHPDTITARHTLSKLTKLLANVQTHTSP